MARFALHCSCRAMYIGVRQVADQVSRPVSAWTGGLSYTLSDDESGQL